MKFLAFVTLALCAVAQADEFAGVPMAEGPYQRAVAQYSGGELYADAGAAPTTPVVKKKSGVLAAVLSLAVPGAGEVYVGDYWRAAPFVAVEAGLWTGSFVYNGKGDDQTREFESFARENWNEDAYWAWWNSLDSAGQARYAHVLPDEQTQQYFEMIGKYSQFFPFWEDYNSADSSSADLDAYVVMRDQANRYYNKADTFVILTLVNRLLSAFDAALAARSHNGRAERGFDVGVRIEHDGFAPRPHVTFSYRF